MSNLQPLAKRYKLNLIIHFGSSAIGRANDESDMDIAIRRDRGTERLTFDDLCEIEYELSRILKLKREVDLVDLSRASPLLLMRIARTGQPLHESAPNLFIEFKTYSMRQFEDNAKYFKRTKTRLQRELRAC